MGRKLVWICDLCGFMQEDTEAEIGDGELYSDKAPESEGWREISTFKADKVGTDEYLAQPFGKEFFDNRMLCPGCFGLYVEKSNEWLEEVAGRRRELGI